MVRYTKLNRTKRRIIALTTTIKTKPESYIWDKNELMEAVNKRLKWKLDEINGKLLGTICCRYQREFFVFKRPNPMQYLFVRRDEIEKQRRNLYRI